MSKISISILNSINRMEITTAVVGCGALVGGFVIGYVFNYCNTFTKRNADEADERRKCVVDYLFEKLSKESIDYKLGWHSNSRGMIMCNQQFIPNNRPILGVIGLVHGYADHTHLFYRDVAERFCNQGYVVLMMDHEGHGLSDGLHAYIPSFDDIVRDQCDYFLKKIETLSLQKYPFFVYGHSMGGAIAFHLAAYDPYNHLRKFLKGVVLCAPMVKVSDDLKPPDSVIAVLKGISRYYPYAPATPIPDILDKCYREPAAYEMKRGDLLHYQRRVRLHTGLVLVGATDDISANLHALRLPVLILHGRADQVTDPRLSQELYDKCSSADKTLKLYDHCWHDILAGESPSQVAEIYGDMFSWLGSRGGDRL